MSVVAHYMRYGVSYEYECATVDEAFQFLASGEDRGDLSSSKVVDGDTVYKRGTPEFERRLHAAWRNLW